MDVRGVAAEGQFVLRRKTAEAFRLGSSGDAHCAELPRFRRRLPRPGAGKDIVRRIAPPLRQKIHRHHGKLKRRASLQEEDVVLVRDARERADVRFRRGKDLVERLRAVANLEDRHADAGSARR